MTSKRANAVNRAIAEACGWKFEPIDHGVKAWGNLYRIFSPAGDAMLRRTSYENENSWPEYEVDDVIPNCYTDMNAAIAAAGELMWGGYLKIEIDGENSYIEWLTPPSDIDSPDSAEFEYKTPADIAAAICEAIVTARQIVVESEVSDGKQ